MRRYLAILEKMAEDVVSEYSALRGRSILTIMTNLGLEAGANPPYEVIVCPGPPVSYFPFEAIWDVPVFPATSYPSTDHFFAKPTLAPSVSMAITFLDVSSLITRRSGVGAFLTIVPSASVSESTTYGCI